MIPQSLKHYWRTNLAVVLGVATAVAVLAGALLVGDSVRGSLRGLALARLGRADYALTAPGFFRQALVNDLQAHEQFKENFNGACALIALAGTATRDENNARAGGVAVYGVDSSFWQFHGAQVRPPEGNDLLMSAGLARELGAQAGDTIILRIEKPSAIPVESLHSRKDDLGQTIRFTLRETLPVASIGEFSLRPQQGAVRSIFVPLDRLQRNLDQDGKANVILLAAKQTSAQTAQLAQQILKETFALADVGVKLRSLEPRRAVLLETESGVINDELAIRADAAAATSVGLPTASFLTYLANTIRAGQREIPYSLVTAVDEQFSAGLGVDWQDDVPPILLNDWAARELNARVGTEVTLDYFVWQESGQLLTKTAKFRVSGVTGISGFADDRDFAPEYPGITSAKSLADWDPPFPVDLSRVRPVDEAYWDKYRTTPKAFIRLADGQKLWATRYGKLTSLRVYRGSAAELPQTQSRWAQSLRALLDPAALGLAVQPVKEQSLQAARGATDFGEYFAYFSFFLVVSALLLATLFFRLGIEQRWREIGLLRAVGFSLKQVRRQFLREGAVLAVAGSALGLLGAIAYAALMMWALRTWWVGAVGTTLLRLHVGPLSLLLGVVGGIVAALACIWWTLRGLRHVSPRALLAGTNEASQADQSSSRRPVAPSPRRKITASLAVMLALAGLALLALAAMKFIGQTGGFFGAGGLLLVAALCGWAAWLRADRKAVIAGQGAGTLARMGFRYAATRPGRSVLCIALIASAAFIIVSVDAFRRDGNANALDRKSGNGGYPLIAESLLPIVHDPNGNEGRAELNISDDVLDGVTFTRFRLRPGDDASCLNLYQPRNPRTLGASAAFIQQGRFAFQSSIAQSEAEKANPWLLLNAAADEQSKIQNAEFKIPVIVDANSMTYVLHKSVGDEITIDGDDGRPLQLKIVAALSDSVLQGELLMSEANFLRAFPQQEGYRVFLIDAAPERAAQVSAFLEERLSDFGFDAQPTAERLAAFHQVENTYLLTFQALGGLGLLLGTVGLAAVLLRNVLERRRELALLRAVGYRRAQLGWMVMAENALLLGCGLLTGVLCALLAILPALLARGGRLSAISLLLLLAAILLVGVAASLVAVRAAVRAPLLASLRAE